MAFKYIVMPILKRFLVTDKLEKLKTSPEALFGFSHSLAALIGCVGGCPLGMPHSRSKQVSILSRIPRPL